MRDVNPVGRPREFDEAEVLSLIMQVFWQKGYEGTSLTDLTAATRLKKGSLYAAFGDKHSMYLKALAHYEQGLVIEAAEYLADGSGTTSARIHDFLSAPIQAAWSNNDFRGCFLCNASVDRADNDPEIARLVQRGFDKLEFSLFTALKNQEFKDSEARQKSRLLLTVYSGLRIMARSGRPRKTLEDARDCALECLGDLSQSRAV